MFFLPNYTIENKSGWSGKIFWSYHKYGLHIICAEPQVIPFHTQPLIKNFNPYKDLQRGYYTFGYKGKNYHVKRFN